MEAIARLTEAQCDDLLHDWTFWARDNQLPPAGGWSTWVFNAGRGAGKTRSGAEWVRSRVKAGSGRVALIAATAADARDVMVEGDSGLLSVCWDKDRTEAGALMGRPLYEPSKRQVTWANGAIAKLYSAEEPDRLRGPQHSDGWCDELAAWKRLQETWDMYQFGLRLGTNPRTIVTTTPRPIEELRGILSEPSTVVTTGSTYENRAFLSQRFLDRIRDQYDGTRLGRQEIYAEMLEDVPGALWSMGSIQRRLSPPPLSRVVVGVDPSGSAGKDGRDEVGIVVAGVDGAGGVYVLDDLTSDGGPAEWGRAAVDAYRKHKADRIVAETNFGGAMVESVLRTIDPSVSYKAVTASRGKAIRAEPVAALYEQGRVYHCGAFGLLESQMMMMTRTGYAGKKSPDRLDALVWAISDLVLAATEWEFT